MRDLIKKTDKEIEAAFGELGHGLMVSDLVFTQDSLDAFKRAAAGYNERGRMTEGKLECGTPYLEIAAVQVRKGDSRGDLIVIDFGEVRATMGPFLR